MRREGGREDIEEQREEGERKGTISLHVYRVSFYIQLYNFNQQQVNVGVGGRCVEVCGGVGAGVCRCRRQMCGSVWRCRGSCVEG